MASDLSLLFQLKAQNQASPAIHSVQADVQKLRQTVGSDFGQMQQVATAALGRITSSITNVSSQVPVLGSAVNALSGQMAGLAAGTGQATAGFTALGGPIGIALAGFVATGLAVEKLAVEIFNLTKQTAEFQGKLFDLSQQTGVSVETLSALEVIAVQTGGSIDSIVASLGIFQKNMEEANDTNSKAAKQFQALDVEITNTEDTLRQTLLALAKMPEGYRQTAAALELFGRGGKQVLAIIKETNGDLDLLIEKLRGAGLVTAEQARQADKFNDELALLGFQLRGLGSEIIPGVTKAVQDLSKFLKENEEAVGAVKTGIGLLAGVFIHPLRGALQVAQFHIEAVTKSLERLGVIAAKPITVGIELKGRDSSGLELLKELKAAGTPIGPGLPSDAELTKAGLLNATGGARGSSSNEAAVLRRAIDRINALTEATTRALAENEAEMIRAIESAKRRLGEFQLSQTEAIRQGFFGDKSELDKANEFVRFLEQAGLKISEAEIAQIRFDAVLIQSLEHAKELASALGEIIELTPGPSGEPGSTVLPNIAGILGEDAPEALRSWKDALIDVQDQMVSFADFANGSLNGAIVGLADSLAQGVVAWALYGQSFGKAMRQALASLAAKIAAEAAFQAALHGAYAIAALAFGDFAGAAQHAIAAAKFAGVAALAGLGAKAIAGNTFSSAGAGGGSSTQSRTTATAPSGPNPVNIDRNRLDIHFHVTRDEGSMVRAWVQDWRNNGQTRQVAQEDH